MMKESTPRNGDHLEHLDPATPDAVPLDFTFLHETLISFGWLMVFVCFELGLCQESSGSLTVTLRRHVIHLSGPVFSTGDNRNTIRGYYVVQMKCIRPLICVWLQ